MNDQSPVTEITTTCCASSGLRSDGSIPKQLLEIKLEAADATGAPQKLLFDYET